jgi:rhodanese-related sulfurtransferase
LDKFKGKGNIVVCRSGNRSSQAKSILEQNGFVNVTNGGTWQDVNTILKKISTLCIGFGSYGCSIQKKTRK